MFEGGNCPGYESRCCRCRHGQMCLCARVCVVVGALFVHVVETSKIFDLLLGEKMDRSVGIIHVSLLYERFHS